jgi:hypothetical protein
MQSYALLQLGQLLEAQGDVDGAHEAWQQAIDAGCDCGLPTAEHSFGLPTAA